MENILEVKNLSLVGSVGKEIIEDLEFSLSKGEILAVIGRSGSGKTLTARTIMNLLPKGISVKSGEVIYKGKDLLKMDDKELQKIRGAEISMIVQESLASLNPLRKVGLQIAEILVSHENLSKRESAKVSEQLLKKVGFDDPEEIYSKYPHELSGGMRQRIIIAIGIACNPEILIADEPTSSLDVASEKEIIELLTYLNKQSNMSIIFITHNLKIIEGFSTRLLKINESDNYS
jgi:ABC-type microcin C transport system duplicated ATPase subunit YejF